MILFYIKKYTQCNLIHFVGYVSILSNMYSLQSMTFGNRENSYQFIYFFISCIVCTCESIILHTIFIYKIIQNMIKQISSVVTCIVSNNVFLFSNKHVNKNITLSMACIIMSYELFISNITSQLTYVY